MGIQRKIHTRVAASNHAGSNHVVLGLTTQFWEELHSFGVPFTIWLRKQERQCHFSDRDNVRPYREGKG